MQMPTRFSSDYSTKISHISIYTLTHPLTRMLVRLSSDYSAKKSQISILYFNASDHLNKQLKINIYTLTSLLTQMPSGLSSNHLIKKSHISIYTLTRVTTQLKSFRLVFIHRSTTLYCAKKFNYRTPDLLLKLILI